MIRGLTGVFDGLTLRKKRSESSIDPQVRYSEKDTATIIFLPYRLGSNDHPTAIERPKCTICMFIQKNKNKLKFQSLQ